LGSDRVTLSFLNPRSHLTLWGYPMPLKHTIKVSGRVYEKLWELARKHNLESPNQLLEKLLFEGVTPSPSHGVTPSHTSVPVDCTARRAKKGDRPLNVYYVECRDGAKAIVPREALADLSERFKLRVKVVE
jgi:hypothetical protein